MRAALKLVEDVKWAHVLYVTKTQTSFAVIDVVISIDLSGVGAGGANGSVPG